MNEFWFLLQKYYHSKVVNSKRLDLLIKMSLAQKQTNTLLPLGSKEQKICN